MMKIKSSLLLSLLFVALGYAVQAQSVPYYVFLTDKQGVTFDPYGYFDAQAIARYKAAGADLYDAANYPLNEGYVAAVQQEASQLFGMCRWLNALAVMATPDQAAAISRLPFVARVQMIGNGDMVLANSATEAVGRPSEALPVDNDGLSSQLLRMQGQAFVRAGYDGRGLRIAVFDGGFPRVNTHMAFQHLRDSNRIVDTWNFPNDKADVYGWNSHGLMTLSCITGRMGNRRLGLATGAEFLLYRTEVGLEPAKEEVWWMMAVERADRHGANIISSSLGYGKERYCTKDMDGTSYVAKAANMAARRGMLVVNSAGNENTSAQWRTIITPADADSVLCVGGIEDKLTQYRAISFTSCGPSADGRLKPEVCAFGHAQVASSADDEGLSWAYGTSFSCPLVAGFAACAWQASPGTTAMQLKEALQHSADRYPYFDYALGYGVPQASYFTGPQRTPKTPTFVFEEGADSVRVRLLKKVGLVTLFFNKQRSDGSLVTYGSKEWVWAAQEEGCIRFAKAALDSCRLNVWYEGYSDSFRLSDADRLRYADSPVAFSAEGYLPQGEEVFVTSDDGSPKKASSFGSCATWWGGPYWQLGSMICLGGKEQDIRFSPVNHLGFRLIRSFSKVYKIGMGIEWAMANYHLVGNQSNAVDELLGTPADGHVTKKYMKQGDWALELFQRVRFVGGGMVGNGCYWDLGLYGAISYYNYHVKYANDGGTNPYELCDMRFNNPDYLDRYKLNWGVTTRVVFDAVGLYLRYRLTGIFGKDDLPESPAPGDFYFNLPRLEAGLVFSF